MQTPEQTLEFASGSCRDSGWLLVQLLRHFGFATRFVSGYLIQLTPDVTVAGWPDAGTAVDFTDLHAWTEVYVPGAGWIELDPTSGLLAGEGHIPLAAAPHPTSAAPISGGHGKAEVEFDFRMEVQRIRETPRVTKPYTEEIWSDIVAAGHAVDARLNAGDVRLTMGGEPTFVAADDMEGAEWNTGAVGPNKRRYAGRSGAAAGAALRAGRHAALRPGQVVSGRAAPALGLRAVLALGRTAVCGETTSLLARETAAKSATIADAERFMASLCDQLGLPEASGIPAYEDAAHFMLVEQKLPFGETPADQYARGPRRAPAHRCRCSSAGSTIR